MSLERVSEERDGEAPEESQASGPSSSASLEWVIVDSPKQVTLVGCGLLSPVLTGSSDSTPDAHAPSALYTEMAVEYCQVAKEACNIHAVLSVVAPEIGSVARAPLHLVAVLDKSGSMSGDKLRLVVATMRFMLRHLTDRDALGLVAYDECVSTLAPLTRCDSNGRAELEAALDSVTAGSTTNLSGGLLRGLGLHQATPCQAKPARPLQRVTLTNTHRRVSDEEAESRKRSPRAERRRPAHMPRVHEWSVELHFDTPEDEALVRSVKYTLSRHTFPDAVVEVSEAPFRLTRLGWGAFTVHAHMLLHDGRVIALEHPLSFQQPVTSSTLLVPLRSDSDAPSGCKCESEREGNQTQQAVVRSTFLFTDGHANSGVTDPARLCNMAAAKLNELGATRCSLSTFGFGADHSAEVLQDLATVGGGVYCHVGSEDKICEAFGEAFGGLLSTTHQNVSLTLDLEPDIKLARAFCAYPVEDTLVTKGGKASHRRVSVDVGDLFAEERRDILVALSVPASDIEGDQILGRFSSSAFSVLDMCSQDSLFKEIVVSRSGGVIEELRNPEVERHRFRHRVTEAIKVARQAAHEGKLIEARERLTSEIERLSVSPVTEKGDPLCVGLLSNLKECLKYVQEEHLYRDSGSKTMANMQHMHQKQRGCVCMLDDENFSYSTSMTIDMTRTFRHGIH